MTAVLILAILARMEATLNSIDRMLTECLATEPETP